MIDDGFVRPELVLALLCTLVKPAVDPQANLDESYYRQVGSLFVEDNGHVSAKLDFLPVDPGWEGWLNAFRAIGKEPPGDDDNTPF